MHPAVTESGRFIAYYTIDEAKRLFGGRMRIDPPQIIVEDDAAEGMTPENGWRYLKNGDGTYSLWNDESFEREFGVRFDSDRMPGTSRRRSSSTEPRKPQEGKKEAEAPKHPRKRPKGTLHRRLQGEAISGAENGRRRQFWPTSRTGEWKVVHSQAEIREERRRELEQKKQQRVERDARLRELHPEYFRKERTTALVVDDEARRATEERPHKTARLTDEEIFALAMREHGENVAAQVKTLLEKRTMEGVVLRVMTIAELYPGITLPKGFSPHADSSRVKNHYCRSGVIRMFCLDFLAGMIERMGDADKPYGAEPLTWALDNCEAGSRLRRRAARQILAELEHTLIFSASCIDEAASCEEALTYIPYRTTLVRIPGYGDDGWGVVAVQDGDEIGLVTIGKGDLTDTARNMLAYVENLCSPRMRDDGATDYRRSSPRRRSAPYGSGDQERDRVHRISSGSVSTGSRPHRGGSISTPHTRRAHTRRQHYGAGNRLVKIIVIRETLVRGRCQDPGQLPRDMRVHRVG